MTRLLLFDERHEKFMRTLIMEASSLSLTYEEVVALTGLMVGRWQGVTSWTGEDIRPTILYADILSRNIDNARCSFVPEQATAWCDG